MYAAYTKRKIADEITQRRALDLAAVWGNPNYDPQEKGEDGARKDIVKIIEESYGKVLDHLYRGTDLPQQPEDDEPDYDDPFWAAMRRGMESVKTGKQKHKLPEQDTILDIENG
jgi:hypothetical protein